MPQKPLRRKLCFSIEMHDGALIAFARKGYRNPVTCKVYGRDEYLQKCQLFRLRHHRYDFVEITMKKYFMIFNKLKS